MSPLGWVVVAVVVAVVLEYLIFDTRRHRPCGGTGWLRSPLTGAMRRCWCDHGKRKRYGRGLGDRDDR